MIKSSKVFKVFIICQLLLLQISGALSIRGGQPEDIKNVPYVVQIFVEGDFICGGTLVSDRVVVTAASCVAGVFEQLTVKAGATNLLDAGIISLVSEITLHYDYINGTVDSDVAVLKLETPIKNDLVKPIDLCNRVSSAGEVAKIYGWGYTTNKFTDGLYSNQLQTVSLKLIGKRPCRQRYTTTMRVTHNMLCAEAQENSSCKGDSGSPAIINNEFCGIVSSSFGCKHPNVPEILTNVFKVRDFIISVMKN